jgi:hypothetical protein
MDGIWHLGGFAVISAFAALVLAVLMTRRGGVRMGLLVPSMAAVAAFLLSVGSFGAEGFERVGTSLLALAFAGPAILGGLVGVLLVVIYRRKS